MTPRLDCVTEVLLEPQAALPLAAGGLRGCYVALEVPTLVVSSCFASHEAMRRIHFGLDWLRLCRCAACFARFPQMAMLHQRRTRLRV
jgi:hypothetical protein